MKEFPGSGSPSMSFSVFEIGKAMLRATPKFTATGLDGKNANQNYRYAKLDGIYHATKKALHSEDIWVKHYDKVIDGFEYIYTRLTHVPSGEWIQDELLLQNEKPGNQGKGIASTYMKKQQLLNLCAICGGEDDDAESEQKHIAERDDSPLIGEEVAQKLESATMACLDSDKVKKQILSYNKVNSYLQLRESQLSGVIRSLSSKPKKVE